MKRANNARTRASTLTANPRRRPLLPDGQQPNVGNHEHTPGTLTNSSGTFNVDCSKCGQVGTFVVAPSDVKW